MIREKATVATIEHVLVYYDGPQLLLLKSDKGEYLLATAIEKEGYKFPIICCQMLPKYLNSYMFGKVDLLFVFKRTPITRLYFADIGIKHQAGIPLRRAKRKELTEDVYPEPGIFSRVHTHPMKGVDAEDQRTRFVIDGTWEARDFSRFHGRIGDTYSLLFIAQKLDDKALSAPEIEFLHSSIAEKPWQGGGSYVSFYGGLKEEAIALHPLRVAGIEYHSPGYVDLAGNSDVLDDVMRAISSVMENHTKLVKIYKSIRSTMKREGLNRATKDYGFSNEASEKFVLKQSKALAEAIYLPNADELYKACGQNTGVFAKLVLSYHRRLKGIADFFIEGRVSNPAVARVYASDQGKNVTAS
jgi:hypothetical protein